MFGLSFTVSDRPTEACVRGSLPQVPSARGVINTRSFALLLGLWSYALLALARIPAAGAPTNVPTNDSANLGSWDYDTWVKNTRAAALLWFLHLLATVAARAAEHYGRLETPPAFRRRYDSALRQETRVLQYSAITAALKLQRRRIARRCRIKHRDGKSSLSAGGIAAFGRAVAALEVVSSFGDGLWFLKWTVYTYYLACLLVPTLACLVCCFMSGGNSDIDDTPTIQRSDSTVIDSENQIKESFFTKEVDGEQVPTNRLRGGGGDEDRLLSGLQKLLSGFSTAGESALP